MYDQLYQKPWTGLKSTQKHNYREIYSSQLHTYEWHILGLWSDFFLVTKLIIIIMTGVM